MRIQHLLLAAFMFALPAVASAAPIDFLKKGNAEIVGVANLGAGVDELTWLDGKTDGADYYVNVLNGEQGGQNNAGYGPNVGDHFDFPWLAANESGDGYLLGLAQVGPPYHFGRIRLFDIPPGKGRDQVTSTPEPATLLLLGTGLVGLATRRRRQDSQS